MPLGLGLQTRPLIFFVRHDKTMKPNAKISAGTGTTSTLLEIFRDFDFIQFK